MILIIFSEHHRLLGMNVLAICKCGFNYYWSIVTIALSGFVFAVQCYASVAYAVMQCLSVSHVRGLCQNK